MAIRLHSIKSSILCKFHVSRHMELTPAMIKKQKQTQLVFCFYMITLICSHVFDRFLFGGGFPSSAHIAHIRFADYAEPLLSRMERTVMTAYIYIVQV